MGGPPRAGTPLRESLTIFACALIALLTAALVGPWLVDWGAHRAFVEAGLSRALGAPVATRGAIDIKLLPTPILALDGFTLEKSDSSLSAGATRLELQVMPLLRGELRFYEATVAEPRATLRLGALPARAAHAPEVRFESVRLVNAGLRVIGADGVEKFAVSGIDIDGSADSPLGPFKGSGSLARDGAPVGFRFATGALENDRMKLKVVADAAEPWPRVDFDGALDLGTPEKPALEGQVVLAGATPGPWRLAGPLRLDGDGGTMERLDLRLGDEVAPINLQGAARLAWGAPAGLNVSLNTRQIDLDRIAASPFAAMARDWLDARGPAAKAPFAVDLTFGAPAATLGGEPLADVSAHIAVAPAAPIAVDLTVGAGPGGARLNMRGEVETGTAAAFRGHVEASASDLPRLTGWLNQMTGWNASTPPARALEVSGAFNLSAVGFSARDLTLKADRTTLSGAVAYTRAIGGARARLFADLASDSFDIDAAPDLTGATRMLADADLGLSIAARAVRVARFGAGTIEAGRIRMELRREGGVLTLEDLSIADLGGASVRASGVLGADGGQLDGNIDAARLGDLAAFLRRVAPGAASEALAARATALSPAKMSFHAQATRSAPDAPLVPTALTVDGTARGSTIKATVRPEGESSGLRASLIIASPDAAMLLRQMGFTTIGAATPGEARLELNASGRMDNLAVDARARLAGSMLGFRGSLTGGVAAAGDLTIDAPDAAPLARLLGYPWPDASVKIPAKLTGRVSVAPREANIADLSGEIAGSAVAGDLKRSVDATGEPRWTGALRVDHLSLPALAVAVLGPPRTTKPGEVWSSTPFAAGMAREPIADIDIATGDLRLTEAIAAADARMRLSLAPNLVQFENVEARGGEARITGRLTLRRAGGDASALGSIGIDGLPLALPTLTGTASGALTFSGSGQSPAALMRGLTGQGDASISGLVIARADPDAPTRVLERAESGGLFISENDFVGALRRELDQASYRASERSMTAAVVAGAIRLTSPDGLSIAYDPSTNTLETRVALAPATLPNDWQGPAPRVGVAWRGPPASPTRDIEASAFNAALTARAIAREQARIEAFEADTRERAFFNRRRKGLEFLNQRARELEIFELDRAAPAAPTPTPQ